MLIFFILFGTISLFCLWFFLFIPFCIKASERELLEKQKLLRTDLSRGVFEDRRIQREEQRRERERRQLFRDDTLSAIFRDYSINDFHETASALLLKKHDYHNWRQEGF